VSHGIFNFVLALLLLAVSRFCFGNHFSRWSSLLQPLRANPVSWIILHLLRCLLDWHKFVFDNTVCVLQIKWPICLFADIVTFWVLLPHYFAYLLCLLNFVFSAFHLLSILLIDYNRFHFDGQKMFTTKLSVSVIQQIVFPVTPCIVSNQAIRQWT
jgi:hypothetical protein